MAQRAEEEEEQIKVGRPKGAGQILKEQIETEIREYKRTDFSLFMSAFAAGMELGFSILLMGAMHTLFADSMSSSSLTVLLAACYPLGFIFIMLGRSELFTEHTALAILPVLSKSEPISDLIKLWVLVFTGNLIGGYIFSLIIVYLGPEIGFIEKETFATLAQKLISYDGKVIFFSSILAGWMMGLLGWLSTSAQESISRIFIIILVTSVISLGGLHHCIIGSIEVFSGMITSTAITGSDYLKFQGWATLGNAIGGVVFVAILKFSHAKVS